MIKPIALFTLTAALIWVAKLSFGQNELKVKTLDSEEQPLSAVLIKLKPENGQEAVEVSDKAGNTSFELSDTGTFTISAHFVGDVEKRKLHLDTGSHVITIHFKRKELNTVLVEAPVDTFDYNWRCGATSRSFKMGIMGGIWMPDSRPPTLGSILNQQPYD